MLILSIFSTIADWYMSHLNYWTIALLMTVESSFIPFPSEIVMPPAAYLASQGELNFFLVILSASIGCLIGALFNYYLSLYLGRALVYKFADSKYARLFLLNKDKVQKAEDYFIKNGNTSTFIGRLIPGIRQLISIPAGLAKMNLKHFILYTVLGSTLWNLILALLGFFFGKNQALFEQHYHELSYIAIGIGVLFVAYLIFKRLHKNSTN
ncbi:MAG: DedA family protein [Bacteroidales bacterium]|nr:DedA family protein [Bacteroidales bacterium]OPZ98780.1 MAG: Inner membrane protein YqjA [Bacteroidetes bacterium ADurb.Bin416]